MSEIEREENLSDPAPLLLAQADLDLERYLRAGGIASRADVRSLLRLLDAERAKVARAWDEGVNVGVDAAIGKATPASTDNPYRQEPADA